MSNDEKNIALLLEAIAQWKKSSDKNDNILANTILKNAEELIHRSSLAALAIDETNQDHWRSYLETTGDRDFLLALDSQDARYRWAETAFTAIRRADYRLSDLLARNVRDFPDRPYLQEEVSGITTSWSYARIQRNLNAIAAVLFNAQPEAPRVAILATNGIAGASLDLACLLNGIFVTPLNVHTDAEIVVWIANQLKINIIATDNDDRCRMLKSALDQVEKPFKIVLLNDKTCRDQNDAILLPEVTGRLGVEEAEKTIASQIKPSIHQVATTLFTSGSTGQPKGVSFSHYHLISKRFARHAALPDVGKEELLFAYLPLFHTFGRYLELLGMLYWQGTYVFAPNPSTETLLAGMKKYRPTGLISIPLRWQQIHDRCTKKLGDAPEPSEEKIALEKLTGGRLRWGLSAAGYLDPRIFRFFQRNGVALGSGFGMTEATGGITMSPPGDYKDDTVGIPLPGMRLEFGEEDELLVHGHYIARYLEEAGPEDIINPDDDYWLKTGDLFQKLGDGHVRIVDRIKDIYKNSKGQTIAPRRVEQKFASVPGIERTFLVGDGRRNNVLLIVPKRDDPLFIKLESEREIDKYFGRLISEANRELAPYERVLNYALIDRDFSQEKGELTAKGSYRRKVIEKSFASTIERLYGGRYLFFDISPKIKIKIPHWFFGDLGILESDIAVNESGLIDKRRNLHLTVKHTENRRIQIGDLAYKISDTETAIDLGLLAQQPWLWIGNPSLIDFTPSKEGWDSRLGIFSKQVYLLNEEERSNLINKRSKKQNSLRDPRLVDINQLIELAFFGDAEVALESVEELGTKIESTDDRLASLIRRRLGTLAEHGDERVRAAAYRILLLDRPMPDYDEAFGVFISSGRTFLNEDSIKKIAQSDLKPRRLGALRQRLHSYRMQLLRKQNSENQKEHRRQLSSTLLMLTDYVKIHPSYYSAVRAELAAWILNDDPALSSTAKNLFREVALFIDAQTKPDPIANLRSEWYRRLVFDPSIEEDARSAIVSALVHPTFFRKTMLLTHDESNFGLGQIPSDGIWVSPIITTTGYRRYRLSISTRKHYDIQLVLRQGANEEEAVENDMYSMAMAGFPFGTPMLPRFGCRREDPQASTLIYYADLTVWEKIRQYASAFEAASDRPWHSVWRKLFVRAFATVFSAWRASEAKIVPGCVSPNNVLVPELDYREGALVLSLTGWSPYERPSDLLRPILRNFYQRTTAHYPWTKAYLKKTWIFDAALEALGRREGMIFLRRLRREISESTLMTAWSDIEKDLKDYFENYRNFSYVPLAVDNAIHKYHNWLERNGELPAANREEIILQLYNAYRLERYSEWSRFYYYRHSYFADSNEKIRASFDILLNQIALEPNVPASQRVELSDLQISISEASDREILSRMIFPQTKRARSLRVQTFGEKDERQVLIRTEIVDRKGVKLTIRSPKGAAEIGKLYRLYHLERYPQQINEYDQYLLVLDAREAIVGGLCYQLRRSDVAFVSSMVVTKTMQRRGIGSALLDEFCIRMQERGVEVVKTNLLLREMSIRLGFRHDTRWGGLVRYIGKVAPPTS